MRIAITATTATFLLIVLAAVIVGFDVLGMVGERLADGFQPLFRGPALP